MAHGEGQREAGERRADRTEQQDDRAPVAVRHPAEPRDQHRLAEAEDGHQPGGFGVVETVGEAIERQQALHRRLADAAEEAGGDQPSGCRQGELERMGVAALFLVLGGTGRRADGERDDDAGRQRHHGDDERQRTVDADAAEHQRPDELAGGVERARGADDAAAVAVVDHAVQPDLGGRPQCREAGAHDEAGGEPDEEIVGGEDRREGGSEMANIVATIRRTPKRAMSLGRIGPTTRMPAPASEALRPIAHVASPCFSSASEKNG